MPISDLSTTEVVSIDKSKKIKDAAVAMRKNQVGCIVVTETFNGSEVPCGILTDRDIALSVIDSDLPGEASLSSVMQKDPIVAKQGDGIFEVTAKMKRFGIRRVPIVNSLGHLKGIVTLDDLLQLMSEELRNLSGIYEIQAGNEINMLDSPKKIQLESIKGKVLSSFSRRSSKLE